MQSGPSIAKPRPKRRRRICRACDACYKRKIQCDAATPRCNWCHHHDIPCTFKRNQERIQERSKSHDSSGTQRLDSTAIPIASQDVTGQLAAPTRQSGSDLTFTVGPQSNLHVGGHTLGNLCTFNGLPFFSATGRQWIKERTGEDVNLEYTSPRPSTLDPSTSNGAAHALPLPDKEFLYQLLDDWQNSDLARLFPFVDRVLFESTVAAAYHNETSISSPGADSARACIHAFTTICLHAAGQQQGNRVIHTEDHLQTAHDLVPRMLHESVTIDGLQANLMLSLCSLVITGNILILEMLLAAAIRFVFHLNGHLAPVYIDDDQFRRSLHVRELFWICYIMDKEFSLRAGHSPCLDENQCDLTLPDIHHTATEFLAGIRLAMLQSEVYHRLYSLKALRQTDAQLLGAIRDLDSALEIWRMSIPTNFRPRLIDRETNALDMQNTIFQLHYLYCMGMIHQASGRCSSWVQNQDTSEAGSSLAISVEASRSMLQKFLDDRLEFNKNNLRFCLPYFLTAVCHLFSNILFNPTHEGIDDDLELFMSVPTHIRTRVPPEIPRLSAYHIKLFEDFVIELGRLASSAIKRAREGFEQNN
ncbi:transcriptional regulator family: Fungal Specific TF [Aspergillus niger]|nr:transcriptional regulator family: Fungal Specific TF [Aspergillus niger]KAI2927853.1 transcriptional regulator family: Fungal Specific TF [Aspergillus niger]KAI2970925.1 transcriptional regulator family: Fungal Specific TF [Aspergillus niger]KAI3030458.1 transcriptional regulator family: Fungal Specific TF [Aspergillus niger]KAI3032220.1 transcriptional regulator family: Fungal Specific TF [Aspergillus niger]